MNCESLVHLNCYTSNKHSPLTFLRNIYYHYSQGCNHDVVIMGFLYHIVLLWQCITDTVYDTMHCCSSQTNKIFALSISYRENLLHLMSQKFYTWIFKMPRRSGLSEFKLFSDSIAPELDVMNIKIMLI